MPDNPSTHKKQRPQKAAARAQATDLPASHLPPILIPGPAQHALKQLIPADHLIHPAAEKHHTVER